MTNRGGQSYDGAGIKGTSPGELAVSCPACPIPSVNLPPNWKSAAKDSEYRRQISNYERDPELGPGFSYLVSWGPYSEYLRRFTNQQEMSTCSGLATLDHANSKYTKGYAMSGIVCTTCRYEFILPEGAGPLQKGKRYANTDYVVVRSTSHSPETKKVASYDIMCQWSKNLRNCLEEFPLANADCLDSQIMARVVHKFHLAAHKESCQITFSLNYEPGVGHSDMKGPERTWFGLQGGGSTKDQGPGYWGDAMDNKFGYWNWSKLIIKHVLVRLPYLSTLLQLSDPVSGTLLAKKYINARTQSVTHIDEFAALSTDVPNETLALWTGRICAWELDRVQPNPYFNPSSSPSESEIRRHLTLEEERVELNSPVPDSDDDFTETKFLLYGLDLEEQQHDTSLRLHPYSIAQCHDALVQLRTRLSARVCLLKYKYVNVRHQAPNTRARNLLTRINNKIEVSSTKYRHAFAMLGALDRREGSDWCSELLELKGEDVRGQVSPQWRCHAPRKLNSLLDLEGFTQRRFCRPGWADYHNQSSVLSGQGPMQGKPGGWRRVLIFSLATCQYQLEGLRAYVCWQADIFNGIHNHFLGIWEGLELLQEHLTEPTYPVDLDSDAMELDIPDV
ncbi:hypothetical protein BJ322DRAFT_1023868 [Thelephora terrestris]|uniref:Uncharacterized protein n=1 Tax=Thelephora terrestris TaxID=56493 RepID=A0A9P6H6P3_9AGAM|nr:hypothetical protein BJ322DRAFT_1023868 [Thelephora terrestris]